jgi:hypothetical protein
VAPGSCAATNPAAHPHRSTRIRADHPVAKRAHRGLGRQPVGIHDGTMVASGRLAIDKKAPAAVAVDVSERDSLEGLSQVGAPATLGTGRPGLDAIALPSTAEPHGMMLIEDRGA